MSAVQEDGWERKFFAFMAKTSIGTQVSSQSESANHVGQRCSNCDEIELKFENLKFITLVLLVI